MIQSKKYKRIYLIVPRENEPYKDTETYPSGAMVLLRSMLLEAGYNKKAEHDVDLIHICTDKVDEDGLRKRLTQFNPDLIGVTVNSFLTRSAKEVIRASKETCPKALVVAGGPHISALRMKVFEDFPGLDVAVKGEGEQTFMEIVNGDNLESIQGICLKSRETPDRPLAENLDFIPLPVLDGIPINKFTGADPVGSYPSHFIMASRGCPFRCIFCNKSIWGPAGSPIRLRSPEFVVREVKWLYYEYGIKDVFFQDDTFNMNREWAFEIYRLLIESGLNKKMTFKAAWRVNKKWVDSELLNAAKKAGFWFIFYGVESGSQKMLNNMKKGTRVWEIKRAFELTHKAGIKTNASFIIGLPGETRETVAETVKLWEELKPYSAGAGHPIPFPGTDLDKLVTQTGHKLVSDYDQYAYSECVVRTESLSRDELIELRRAFVKKIKRQYLIDAIKLRYVSRTLVFFTSYWAFINLCRRIGKYITSMLSRTRA